MECCAKTIDALTTVEDISRFVDQIKIDPHPQDAQYLTALLTETHVVYRDKSTETVSKIRGYVIAAFEQTGLSDEAHSYLIEVFETSYHPYLVAAAARALRSKRELDPTFAQYLVKSIYNIWQKDEPINFTSYDLKWPLIEYSTAVTELLITLANMKKAAQGVRDELLALHEKQAHRLHPKAKLELIATLEAIPPIESRATKSCCGSAMQPTLTTPTKNSDATQITHIMLEDQDGQRLTWGNFFQGQFSVVVFFYTRCMNPRKCTQTIHNLVDIQRGIDESQLAGKVKTAAITYDEKHDTSRVLRSYGDARKFRFSNDHRMFRVPELFEEVAQTLLLGVNYTGSQVNHHRVELFILDKSGKIVQTFLRVQFDPENILNELHRLV